MAVVSEERTDLLLHVTDYPPVENGLDTAIGAHHHKARLSPVSGKFKPAYYSELNSSKGCWIQRLPSLHRCLFHVAALSHILLGLALLVTVPQYYSSVLEAGGDSYSGLYLVVALSTIVLILLMILRRCWDSNFRPCAHTSVTKLLGRDAFFFTLGLLGCAYARGRTDGVPCHLQDGLLFLSIPVSIIFVSCKKSKGT